MIKIPVGEPYLGEEDVESVLKVMRSGWIARGKELELFEKNLADYHGVKHAVTLSSGTDAIEVALRSLGIKGKEVITTATSCAPSANGILRSENKPVFVDSSLRDYNIDVTKIEEAITKNTKAIMPVHIYGSPCNMQKIKKIAERYDLFIIEDCAQSMGAKFKGKLAGTFGSIGCFSLNINKIITTGEGGFIITNDDKLAKKANIIKNYGRDIKGSDYCYTTFGSNFKLTNLQAALGLSQLNKIEEIIKKRRENAKRLIMLLDDLQNMIQLPLDSEDYYSVYFSFPILIKKDGVRDKLREFLIQKGIETRTMFRPIPKQPYFEELFGKYEKKLPVAEILGKNGLYTSCSPTLKKEQLDYLILALKEGLNEIK